ncbi:tape measure protein [Affinirhizobium pseudoryzae]|uniref:tape measure protein n=1 Tax=Allorhizobium pseudoryzae TaxID=379684 RepID=UPI0013EA8F60|nr:tape measure protein [Allorhizobium pseudoryzae]
MAAQDLERLVVQLSADIKKYENALNRANGITNARARVIESRFAKMNKGIAAGFGGLATSAAAAFAAIGGAQGLKQLSDTATRIDNALKVAGLAGAELESVYQSLFAAATKNAAPIESLVTLYGRLALVQGELGISSQQIVSFSENIALALRVGGVSAQQASGALLQLSQALGGGTVRAEEFNSVLEGAPTILQAAAAGIKEADGSVAKLWQIMLDGELSSKAFFAGFQAGAPVLEQKVANSVFTIDQRLTNLGTALVNAAKEFNQSSEAGQTFGVAIDDVSRFVNSVNFDKLIRQIQVVVEQFRFGIESANDFAGAIGRLSGFDGIGRDIVNLLPGDGAQKSFFGGALTVTSTAAISDRINQAFENEVNQASDLTAEAIRKSVLGKPGAVPNTTTAKATRLPAAPQPISINDPAFAATPTTKPGGKPGGGSRGGGGKQSEFQREVEQIKERTAALQAETEAQKSVCGSIFILEEAQ